MPATPKTAALIFNALIKDRGTAKEAAIRSLDQLPANGERVTLRVLLRESLMKDFVPPAKGQNEDHRSSDTRCWLLSALGRVADDDENCNKELRRHLDAD